VVHLETTSGQLVAPVTILGAWDADLERRIFANGSEIAQRMMGSSVGDEVEIEEGTATITRIEAWSG
jgi:transcription elongation GreA/GreB family factor